MDLTFLFIEPVHPAIEERYGQWQSESLLRAGHEHLPVVRYHPDEPANAVAARVRTSHVVAITNPLVLPSRGLATKLAGVSAQYDGAAVVPAMNESPNVRQVERPIEPYLTLRQFEEIASKMEQNGEKLRRFEWTSADPALFLAPVEFLKDSDSPLRTCLSGREVLVAAHLYAHRFASQRGQFRSDILPLVPESAKNVLEFGCGEALLGAAIKQRQQARVIGVELDPSAAAVARQRVDEVYSGDVRELIRTVSDKFDCIVGGDILEHLDEPWSFLQQLRSVTQPGGHLILSLPNIGSWPIIVDLLRGRFDYVYMGILCAGHLRFFTRSTIEDMLTIAGWELVSVTTQDTFRTSEYDDFLQKLDASGIPHNGSDLGSPGFYVVAKNP